MPAGARIFLLSPARLDGKRARLLHDPRASFPIAAGLRTREGLPIGDVFGFLSGLYFRGKLAYARRFARTPSRGTEERWLGSGALVITQNRGLLPVESRVCLEHLLAFAQTDVHHDERGYRGPLERDAALLVRAIGPEGEVVLLGSIATPKYTQPLVSILGDSRALSVRLRRAGRHEPWGAPAPMRRGRHRARVPTRSRRSEPRRTASEARADTASEPGNPIATAAGLGGSPLRHPDRARAPSSPRTSSRSPTSRIKSRARLPLPPLLDDPAEHLPPVHQRPEG